MIDHRRKLMLYALILLTAAASPVAAQATPPTADQVEWVYRVRYGGADEWWTLFRKYQIPILDEEKRRGFVRDYSVVRPGLHTSENARWDYRIVITYTGYDGLAHEGEAKRALSPDRATLKREENRRWELSANHWDLQIHTIDPHGSPG